MPVYTEYAIAGLYLGSNATDADSDALFTAISGGRNTASYDDAEQRDAVAAYVAFISLGWEWPFEKPEGV